MNDHGRGIPLALAHSPALLGLGANRGIGWRHAVFFAAVADF